MSFLTVLFACMFYAAAALLVVGLFFKIRSYARTPAPLKIPTTPAPTTATGVMLRMTREVTLFESLFKSNKWIWLFGYLFHVSLLLVTLRHLRYFTEPVWFWVEIVQPFGLYAGFVLRSISLCGLVHLPARKSTATPPNSHSGCVTLAFSSRRVSRISLGSRNDGLLIFTCELPDLPRIAWGFKLTGFAGVDFEEAARRGFAGRR